MKTIKLWRVKHRSDERGFSFTVRYATTEKVATVMATQPWGFCGALGECDEIELSAYEMLAEVLDHEEVGWTVDTSHIGA